MDELDHKLIAELRINGRASVPQLAELLGIARATAQRRMDRLIEDGTIRGFTVKLRDDAGSDQLRATMLVEFSKSPIKPTISAIKRVPGIAEVSNTNGKWDIIAHLEVPTMKELNQLVSHVRALDGVGKSEIFILLGPA